MNEGNTITRNDLPESAIPAFATIISILSHLIGITLAKRFMNVALIVLGFSNASIAKATSTSLKTVKKLRKAIENGDFLKALTVGKSTGRKRKYDGHVKEIKEKLNTGDYFCLRQIADMMSEVCTPKEPEAAKVEISTSEARRFCKEHGYTKYKCRSLPAKADLKAQREFYEEILKPLMDAAKENKLALLFMDASHFVMGSDFIPSVWSLTRRFVKTYSGRQRYNVLGAIDFISKEVLTITNTGYINSKSVTLMLKKIANAYPGQEIHLILDNAAYQRCMYVQETAESMGICLHFLPPYSPNLNLIERLWKLVKSELRKEYYDDFKKFRGKIDSILINTTKKYYDKVNRLISDKVELFDELEKVTAITSQQVKPQAAAEPPETPTVA